jgi:cytochrome c-type biogenesis protein CcmH/NrfG
VPVATPVPVGGGLMLPNPDVPAVAQPKAARLPVRPDGKKANELIVIGDRLFKAGNIKRAEERYEQARRSNPNSATPQIRLAQIALSRNDYAKAAEVIRLATTTEPGWYLVANDIQALYNEPADFAKVIGKLESHLQRSPNDRDAWLVLGTQFYLSGRSRQAGDVFRRLNDRKPDTTLAAMLDATTPDAPPKPKP